MDTDESVVLSFNSHPAFQATKDIIFGELNHVSDNFDLGYSDKLVTCFDSIAYTILKNALHCNGIEVNVDFVVCS